MDCTFSEEHDAALCATYPALFSRRHDRHEPLKYGFACGDGWYSLIDALCASLQAETDKHGAPQLVAVQVKEKLGELRFYVAGAASMTQFALIDFATRLSLRTCEICGAPGELGENERGWYSTRCATHRAPDTQLTRGDERRFFHIRVEVPSDQNS